MAAATGYDSLYGWELYDTTGTTEDWNYAAQGAFGYTIEIGPVDGEFHMPYETGFVKEWNGETAGNGQGPARGAPDRRRGGRGAALPLGHQWHGARRPHAAAEEVLRHLHERVL